MHQACLEIDLLPAHRDELRDPQAMPIGQKYERPLARSRAAHRAGGLQQLLDLRRGQIFASAPIQIRGSARGDPGGGRTFMGAIFSSQCWWCTQSPPLSISRIIFGPPVRA